MAEETKTRTFVKKTRDGRELTREVTGAGSEVEARFDGFHEKATSAKSSTSGSSRSSSSS